MGVTCAPFPQLQPRALGSRPSLHQARRPWLSVLATPQVPCPPEHVASFFLSSGTNDLTGYLWLSGAQLGLPWSSRSQGPVAEEGSLALCLLEKPGRACLAERRPGSQPSASSGPCGLRCLPNPNLQRQELTSPLQSRREN